MDVYYRCTLVFVIVDTYKAYLCHFPGENSPNVLFEPGFQASTRPEMHFETSDLIGRALQQEPISERLSYGNQWQSENWIQHGGQLSCFHCTFVVRSRNTIFPDFDAFSKFPRMIVIPVELFIFCRRMMKDFEK